MKTYAIQQTDFVGATYNVGYVLAEDQAQADAKAREIHAQARAVPANVDQEQDAIDRLLDDANRETHERLSSLREDCRCDVTGGFCGQNEQGDAK